MQSGTEGIVIIVVAGTMLMLLLATFVASFFFLHQRRILKHKQELARAAETFQRELLQAQIEIQNHTLQQIAQELHDNIGQLLTVVIMRLNSLEDEIEQTNTQQSVKQTRDLVRTVITDVRSLSKTLDYETVERFGLLPSLTLELERIQRIGRIQTQLVTSGEAYSLGEQPEIVLLRMAQESINNALKHANARNLIVTTDYNPDNFTLTIADDGKGFNIEEASARKLDQAGAGLNNLNRRSGLLGGTCTVESRPGEGTRVKIQVPRN
jgi:signal transduction histidine kinase